MTTQHRIILAGCTALLALGMSCSSTPKSSTGEACETPGESFTDDDGCSRCVCTQDKRVQCDSAPCGGLNAQSCPPCEGPPSSSCVGSGPCGCGPYVCPDDSADLGGADVAAGGVACGEATCGPDELCMRLPGCPIGMELDPVCVPIPESCDAELTCGCFAEDPCGGGCTTCAGIADGRITCECACKCAAPDTLIATPAGERRIDELKVGDLVYSVEADAVVVVPLREVGRLRVDAHQVMRVELVDGTVLNMSPGHPTADGRLFADLQTGGTLDGHLVRSAALVAYTHEFTHDVLPASASGAYFASGVLVGSTLASPHRAVPRASATRAPRSP